MKMLKKYSVFTSPWYKILMWGVIPAVQLAVTLILNHFLKDIPFTKISGDSVGVVFIAFLTPVMMLLLTEVISDIFFMKAVDKKRIAGMGYMLSSSRGKGFFSSAVIVDMIRRVLVVGVFSAVPYFFYLRGNLDDPFLYFSAVLSIFGGILLELFFSRLSGTFVMCVLIAMIGVYVVGPYIMFVALIPRWVIVLVDIAVILVTVFYFYDIFRKLGRSYCDE